MQKQQQQQPELKRTTRRVEALRFIAQGDVTYSAREAAWAVAGETVAGWDYRTFTEIRNTPGLLVIRAANDRGKSKVDLTAAGKKLLASWLD